MTQGEVLEFQNRTTAESAGNNRDDGMHELKHASDITAASPGTLDFPPLSEFLVATRAFLTVKARPRVLTAKIQHAGIRARPRVRSLEMKGLIRVLDVDAERAIDLLRAAYMRVAIRPS